MVRLAAFMVGGVLAAGAYLGHEVAEAIQQVFASAGLS